MVAAMLLVMGVMNLIVRELVKPTRRILRNATRTIESQKPHSQLRILTPFYSFQDVPGLIRILQLSNPTTTTTVPSVPVVIALRLSELTSHNSSATNLFIQDLHKPPGATASGNLYAAQKKSSFGGVLSDDKDDEEEMQVLEAFGKYEEKEERGGLHLLTTTSPYTIMHEDVCSLAYDQRIALVIIPFHQQEKLDGRAVDDNTFVRGVNQNILAEAPCSVAIFVDRGFTSPAIVDTTKDDFNARLGHLSCRIAVLFFGGADDREALHYGWRMSAHRNVSLSVTRFVLGPNGDHDSTDLELLGMPYKANPLLSHTQAEYEKQKRLDDIFIEEFQTRTEEDEMVWYSEVVSRNGEDTVAAIMELGHDYDLYLVGKGDSFLSPLTTGLSDWSDWPELGAIGDILVTSDFARHCSVMVIQQHVGTRTRTTTAMLTSSPRSTIDDWRLPDGSVRHSESMLHSLPTHSMQRMSWSQDNY